MHAADTYSTCYSHSPLCVVERGRSAAPRLRPAPCMHCSSLFLPTVPRQAEIANHCTETHVAMRGRVRSIEACPRRRCAARFGAHGQTESGQARPGPVARPLAACRLHACTHVLASEGGSGQLTFAACTLQYHRLGQDRTPVALAPCVRSFENPQPASAQSQWCTGVPSRWSGVAVVRRRRVHGMWRGMAGSWSRACTCVHHSCTHDMRG